MKRRLNKLVQFCITGILLSSCSLNGNFILHNSGSHSLLIQLLGSSYDKNIYQIPAGETRKFRFNIDIENTIAVTYGDKQWCYEYKPLPESWINTSVSGGLIYASFSTSGKVSVYMNPARKDDYYKYQPPTQPVNYPLKPTMCAALERVK